jgi:hypothetical protein
MLFAVLIMLGTWLQAGHDSAFESDLWPDEGRPVFVAVARQLVLHELPCTSSKVIRRLSVAPKRRLVFGDTRYRTMKPGRFLALVSTSIKGRMLGDIARLSRAEYYSDKFSDASINVRAGDTIEYLQYRAEGTCFVRVAGKTIDADPCPTEELTRFRLDVKPITEWWIRITANGTPAGWLLVTDATVKEIDREG